jgi:IS5 family transposase
MATIHVYKEHDKQKSLCRYGQQSTLTLKRIFGFDKVRYRGIAKNHHRLCACFALVNLYLHRKRLVGLAQDCA